MRQSDLSVACAIAAILLCSCGSGGPAVTASSDASAEASSDAAPFDAGLDAPPDGPAVVSTACDNAQLVTGCTVGACSVSAVGDPLPTGTTLGLTQSPVPSGLNGDTLGSVLCSVSLPNGLSTLPNLELSITLPSAPDAKSALFQYVSPALSRAVPTSHPVGGAVVGLVTAPGDFGATEQPDVWSLQGRIGVNVSSSANQVSLLRNLSSQSMADAFYDGTRLYVCNGTRLLIYSKGIPTSPATLPDVVLGQPDLNTTTVNTSSSLFGSGGCFGLWSDGKRLVVGQGNRILVWNTIPTQNAAPADIVLGQPDFTSNAPNNGGVSAASLGGVAAIDSDGTRLAVAEIRNNRVLIWNTFPVTVDQPADFVVAQPDFSSNAAFNGAASIEQAWGTLIDAKGVFVSGEVGTGLLHVPPVTANNPAPDFLALPTIGYTLEIPGAITGRVARTPNGGLAVRDAGRGRIVMFRSVPTRAATSVDFVLGEPDTTRIVSSPVSASVVEQPAATEEGLGAGAVFMSPDSNRLLVFDTPPTFNFEPASRVIGQAGFTTNGTVDYGAISASTMAGPADVAVAQGKIAVADRGNNRVLLFNASDAASQNAAAVVVLGQPDAVSYVPNLDQRTPSASRLSGPSGVALDGTHLVVADTENHRVLVWNTVPTQTGAAADLVLGQADFAGRRPNRGRGDANADGFSDAAADGFFYPTGVASDGTHLFVADRLNNRVLVWNTFPTANGQPADAVLGQADFTGTQSNRGNGGFTVVDNGFNLPTGVTLSGTTLWVADTENNRVVRWDNATTAPAPGAFVGQTSGTTVSNMSYGPTGIVAAPATTASSVLRPRAVAVGGGRLYVSETDSNRVHMFDATSLAPLGELGQSSDTGAAANAAGVTGGSLSEPVGLATDGTTLWVADSANNRVAGFAVSAPPATGAVATLVLGQPSLLTNGFNQASTAANGVTAQPAGVALAGGNLYVADTGNNRVLVLKTPVAAGQAPTRVYGQPDMLQALPNTGGAPSAHTLNGPRGVFVDGTHVLVADTGNNRVLVFDPNATSADAQLVLGQPNFTSAAANAGGAGPSTMQAPAGVFSDGKSLWVADTGNHRVLVWKTFPTSSGQAADLVIGQTSFSATLPNQGASAASASSLLFPSSIDVVGGVTYVADTGNNRVVFFSTAPASSGPSADGVLGQADLVSRTAAVSAGDASHSAGPVAVVDDGENLYVTDRDLGRVLVYAIGTLATSAPASFVVGPAGGLTLRAPAGLAVERTPFFTSRLYIADTGDNQLAVTQSVSRLASP